jgi:hypothetical protein
MATRFERLLGKTAVAMVIVAGIFIAAVGIYTLLFGNSFSYNLGYSIGYAAKTIASIF